MNLRSPILVACIGSLLTQLSIQAFPAQMPPQMSVSQALLEQQPTQLSVSQQQHLARLIAVKVLSGETWGSGILIQRQGQVYTVVTNEHVLVPAPTHRIQTPDGHIYLAEVIRGDRFGGNDLGLLQFSSNATYAVAALGSSSTLQVGDEVFAAGFPIEGNPGFIFTTGQISLLPDKALEQGYQLAYTNDIQKGMSGGPLLNRLGQVVGINGMHAYPLWGDPYVFQDGSQPCEAMRQVMIQSSWAIPIETLARLVPRFSVPVAAQKGSRSSLFCGNAAQFQHDSQPIIVDPPKRVILPEPLW